jgi:hypothetical protein
VNAAAIARPFSREFGRNSKPSRSMTPGMSTFDPSSCAPQPSSSLSFFCLTRSRWPYLVGAFAGPVLAAGAVLLMLSLNGGPGLAGAGGVGLIALALGGGLLGVAWCGVLRHGHGGAGPILGSFAVPLAIAYFFWSFRDWGQVRIAGMLFVGALAACAWGLVLVRGLGGIRVLAALAAVLWSAAFLVIHPSLALPATLAQALWTLALGALAVTGCSLVVGFPRLRAARSLGAR